MLRDKLKDLRVKYDKWKPRVDKFVIYGTFALLMDSGIGNRFGGRPLHQHLYSFPKEVENTGNYALAGGLVYCLFGNLLDDKKKKSKSNPRQLSFDF